MTDGAPDAPFVAVMPEGVEHKYLAAKYPKPVRPFVAVMPEGVEHLTAEPEAVAAMLTVRRRDAGRR